MQSALVVIFEHLSRHGLNAHIISYGELKTKTNVSLVESHHSFYANTYLKAFILNACVISITAVLSVWVRDVQRGTNDENFKPYFIILLTDVITCILVYIIFYYLFHYGGGLLSSPRDENVPFF